MCYTEKGVQGQGIEEEEKGEAMELVPGKFVMHIYSFHSCTHSLSDFVPFMHPFTL
tara:strand:+ start:2364 stop:2531 length:168 start_codon:yes stop_codon:yes gene_type:complete